MLDLWAGISGLCIALLQLGLHFYGVAAECDETARYVAGINMPNLVHVPQVEQLTAAQFVPLLRRRAFRGVIMGGGSPCQGNSSLNLGRQGLADPRSQQPLELQRLRREFDELPEMVGVELVVFLENVGSMPPSVRQSYNAWLRAEPITVDAATCGWVRRKRLYWLATRSSTLNPALSAPSSWDWVPTEGGVPELRYAGDKPLPNKCFFGQGFQPMINAKEVLAQKGHGAMHPFTREFYHPADRTASSSAAAVERFMADSRRFPPSAYEEASLLWRDAEWRQPLPHERAQLMGLPPESLDCVPGDTALRRQRQNSLIGNGFHLYSVLAVFCLLPQLLEAKIQHPLVDVEECALKARLLHTVWEPGRLDYFPGLTGHQQLAEAIPTLFPECVFTPLLMNDIQRRLSHCNLRALQSYVAWCRLRGMVTDDLGPQPLGRQERARIYSGLSGQRHPTDSTRGLDHLLPPGLGKTGHMAASAALPSPFRATDWPEHDVTFVLEAVCVWRQFLPVFSATLRRILKSVATAVQPLEDALDAWRVESAHRVASSKRPGFVAVLTLLLRWPDRLQAQCLVRGYPIVGQIAQTGVFRPVPSREVDSLEQWLDNADAVVDALVHSRPPRHAEDILEQTLAEQAKGFCSQLMSRTAVDSLFGRGNWRPLERFQVVQADNKRRMIDNARRTQHNSHTSMSETIFTVSIDFVASVAASLGRRLCDHAEDLYQALPWLRLWIGTDDLPDAYRGLPVLPAHQRFSVVAIFVPNVGWRFTLLWGLAFGLESAVVAFNRFPQLGIAISRRCTLGLTAAYFDDELAVETIADSDVSQAGLRLTFQLLGAPPQPEKGYVPAANRHYLGTSLHTGDFLLNGFVRVQPKFSTLAKVKAKLESVLEENSLSRDDAGKLRGDINWLFTMCMGHLGKIAGPALTAHQHGDAPGLSPLERLQLQALYSAVIDSRPRDIYVHHRSDDVVRIYSDASFEDDVLRLGWVIFPSGGIPLGGTTVVPQEVIATWRPRQQQIYPGETLAAVVVPALAAEPLASQSILWFIDNEAAAAALIRASTSEADVLTMVQQAHLQFSRLQARTWFEWIDSESNPADGLSRDGLQDTWTSSQPWRLQEFPFPSVLGPGELLESLATPSSQSFLILT